MSNTKPISVALRLLQAEAQELESDIAMDWPNKDTLDLKASLDAMYRENLAEVNEAIRILECHG